MAASQTPSTTLSPRTQPGDGPAVASGEGTSGRWVEALERLRSSDLPQVGGKNASLGEMIHHLGPQGIRVPPGFATTADAYRRFLEAGGLVAAIRRHLDAWHSDEMTLAEVGAEIRARIEKSEWPEELADTIRRAYAGLCRSAHGDEPTKPLAVAVRSSATAEDLPEASFAGQLESFLNVVGEDALLDACRHCYASLYTDRAIAYRHEHGFDDLDIALSVGVQTMVRSDRACAGVLFTLDTETGFPRTILIQGAWGLGESVVQGIVGPDEYSIFTPFLSKPELAPILERRCGSKEIKVVYDHGGGTRTLETRAEERRALTLADDEVLRLARWGAAIAEHYGRPMDIEWAKDGDSGDIFIVQARPETVQSRRESAYLQTYRLDETGTELVTGAAVGDAIVVGEVCLLSGPAEIDRFRTGSILVTPVTDPDWVPIMRRAAGIVTDHGGRTSHAAIVSRELGIPAVVGTGDATRRLQDGRMVTLSCAEGDVGRVYEGELAFTTRKLDLEAVPETRTKVMINVASPPAAMRWWRLPCCGVGLLRMEYIVGHIIRIHPMALARYDQLEDKDLRSRIDQLTQGYDDKGEYFVDRLSQGLATIAASRYPDPVIVRMSDFKTNEYATLVGGEAFEPKEENPMLGWRGASRYYAEGYRAGFALECAAVHRVREVMGFTNVKVMIPFCRTLHEADAVLAALAEHGLRRGENDLEVWVMCEIPANVLLAEGFSERFDGFSIGSNDLTQLVLGVDRDSERLAHLFDENDDAVRWMIREVIRRAHACGRPVGLCGQRPSDDPDFAAFLVEAGIDSISVTPDSVLATLQAVANAESPVPRGKT